MAVSTPHLKYFGCTTIKRTDVRLRSTCDFPAAIFRPTPSVFACHFTHDNEYCTLSFMNSQLDQTFVDLYQSSVLVRILYLPRILVRKIKIMLKTVRRNASYILNNITAAVTMERDFYYIIAREIRRRVEILLYTQRACV